ncbi:MAG TPA: hypothetical protein VM716_00610 [Gemmatimonadales bacterium]|nr:hypothetical protein [Gemmatimonadales bacterium]
MPRPLRRFAVPTTAVTLAQRPARPRQHDAQSHAAAARAGEWIRRVEGPDPREHRVELAAQGRRALERATPAWQRVQRRLRTGLGRRHWVALQELVTSVVAAVWRT